MQVYTTTAALQLAIVVIHCVLINYTHKIKYNKLVNPIVLLGPALIVQYIIIRIGALSGYFYPNALQDSTYGDIIKNYFYNIKYINIFGIVPEILLIGDLIIGGLIDGLYWVCLDKRRRLMINETSNASLDAV